jgi:hypothetical protein
VAAEGAGVDMRMARSLPMSLTPEQRRGRAQKAARARWHGEDAETTPEIARLEEAALDRHIDALVASWPKMTDEQAARLRPMFSPPKAGKAG